MKKNLKCPMCDSSDFKEENGYYVCRICGNRIPVGSQSEDKSKGNKTPNVNRWIRASFMFLVLGAVNFLVSIIGELTEYGRVNLVNLLDCFGVPCSILGFTFLVMGLIERHIPVESQFDNLKDFKKFDAKELIIGGLIGLLVGATIFLGVVIVGLAVYGRVYLFDNHFTGFSMTSIILLIGGFISLVMGLMERRILVKFPLEDIKDFKKFKAKEAIILGLILIVVGATIFLCIVIVGLTVYGRVYLFDDHSIYSSVFSIFLFIGSILLLVGGFISLVMGLIMKYLKK